jgi:hypothetical protein
VYSASNILGAKLAILLMLHTKNYNIESVPQSSAVPTSLYGLGCKDKNVEVWKIKVFHFSSYPQHCSINKKCLQKTAWRTQKSFKGSALLDIGQTGRM